jgi:hypothetical protein
MAESLIVYSWSMSWFPPSESVAWRSRS